MTDYYVVSHPDGTDFNNPSINYIKALLMDLEVRYEDVPSNTRGYLSVFSTPTDCVGMTWPCRLFRVEPSDPSPTVVVPTHIGCSSLRVVNVLPPDLALGPQGRDLMEAFEKMKTLSVGDMMTLVKVSDDDAFASMAARNAVVDSAGCLGRGAAMQATWGMTGYEFERAYTETWDGVYDELDTFAEYVPDLNWNAVSEKNMDDVRNHAIRVTVRVVRNAIRGLMMRDAIDQELYDTLTTSWRKVVGPLHPQDEELRSL